METKEFGKILITKDYSEFKKIASNRRINLKTYAKLIRSMREEQLIIPICVNEKLEIIDGQHRFKCCQELELPVYYYVLEGYTTSQMKRANLVSSTWKRDDFLHAYLSEGIEQYIKFNLLKTNSALSTNDLIAVLSKIRSTPVKNIVLEFDEGNLELNEWDIMAVEKLICDLEDFNFFKDYKSPSFVKAFLELYFYPSYDHSIMQNKLKTRSEALEKKFLKEDYLKMLTTKIYSYNTSKNAILFNPARNKLYTI